MYLFSAIFFPAPISGKHVSLRFAFLTNLLSHLWIYGLGTVFNFSKKNKIKTKLENAGTDP